jgi:hypothetical protein
LALLEWGGVLPRYLDLWVEGVSLLPPPGGSRQAHWGCEPGRWREGRDRAGPGKAGLGWGQSRSESPTGRVGDGGVLREVGLSSALSVIPNVF